MKLTPEQLREQAAVMIAFANGAKVRARNHAWIVDDWVPTTSPVWDFSAFEYAVVEPVPPEKSLAERNREVKEACGGDPKKAQWRSILPLSDVREWQENVCWTCLNSTVIEYRVKPPEQTEEEKRIENNRQVEKEWNESGRAFELEVRRIYNDGSIGQWRPPITGVYFGCSDLEYRRKPAPTPEDPHKELREKWEASGRTLVIERYFPGFAEWRVVHPTWIAGRTYREKPSPEKPKEEELRDAHFQVGWICYQPRFTVCESLAYGEGK